MASSVHKPIFVCSVFIGFSILTVSQSFFSEGIIPPLTKAFFISKEIHPSRTPGIHVSDLDLSSNPGDDFFQYANGGWLSKTHIPKGASSWTSFDELRHYADSMIIAALEGGSKNETGTFEQKAIDYFKIGTDSMLAEQAGIEPLRPYLEKIKGIKDDATFQEILKETILTGHLAPIKILILSDTRNGRNISKKRIICLGSADHGLPDKDYYTKDDTKSKQIREAYKVFLNKLFQLKGDDEMAAMQSTEIFFKIEMELAAISMTKEELRKSRDRTYHPCSINDLSLFATMIHWKKFMTDLNIRTDTVVVLKPEFYENFEKVFRSHSWNDIKIYFTGLLLQNQANYLTYDFALARFEFHRKFLRQERIMEPLKNRVLNDATSLLGQEINKLFVIKNFLASSKENVIAIGEDIKRALVARIHKLDWMVRPTKEKAIQKIQAVELIIGRPEKCGQLSELKIVKSSYCENVMNARRQYRLHYYGETGNGGNENEWSFDGAQSVRFNISPFRNGINIPSGLLQYPFYRHDGDAAINYGGIGVMIAHEILRMLDEGGSGFDKYGNRTQWWSEMDHRRFVEKSKPLKKQFNKTEVLPGVFVKGEFTIRENINDIGAVNIAFDALSESLRKNPGPGRIDGFTAEQRFFISWSTSLREKRTENDIRALVTNPAVPRDAEQRNPPAHVRVNGCLSNINEFYDAFGLEPADRMYRSKNERVSVW